MAKVSAGLMMYRMVAESPSTPEARAVASFPQVLLVHPGGPFWRNKDDGAWTFPRGEVDAGEDELSAARREFREETGSDPAGPFVRLGTVKHRSGKVVHAWAFQGDIDPAAVRSNTFRMEWPPKSGEECEFPEIDRAQFFALGEAARKLMASELPLLKVLEQVCLG